MKDLYYAAKPTIYANVNEDDLADKGGSNPHVAVVREHAQEGAEVTIIESPWLSRADQARSRAGRVPRRPRRTGRATVAYPRRLQAAQVADILPQRRGDARVDDQGGS